MDAVEQLGYGFDHAQVQEMNPGSAKHPCCDHRQKQAWVKPGQRDEMAPVEDLLRAAPRMCPAYDGGALDYFLFV